MSSGYSKSKGYDKELHGLLEGSLSSTSVVLLPSLWKDLGAWSAGDHGAGPWLLLRLGYCTLALR